MPHINSVRVVNVHFNNATQFYDDFTMDFYGQNATYDLENGGGKSLLLLMLLQTVLPKSHLRKEKPVSLIFQGKGDTTSHSVVEWILDEGHSYPYMLTGFSARIRRGKGEGLDAEGEEPTLGATDIEHLSWYVFSNKATKCKNVPLTKERAGGIKSYANFDDIRKYIQQLQQKGIPAQIFDVKEKFQREIASHNLISAEWSIIRGINSGESNIESYFRQRATSRKLIEQLFVPIIEEMEALKRNEKNNQESLRLADALIGIRNRLKEYHTLKGHMAEYEKIREYYVDFCRRNDELLFEYEQFNGLKQQAAAIHSVVEAECARLDARVKDLADKVNKYRQQKEESERQQILLQAGQINLRKTLLAEKHRQLCKGQETLEQKSKEAQNLWQKAKVLESYDEYKKINTAVKVANAGLEALKANESELQQNYRLAAGRYRYLLTEKKAGLGHLAEELQKEERKLKADAAETSRAIIAAEKKETEIKTRLEGDEDREKQLDQALEIIKTYFYEQSLIDAIMEPEACFERIDLRVQDNRKKTERFSERLEQIDSQQQLFRDKKQSLCSNLDLVLEKKKGEDEWLGQYEEEYRVLRKMAATFGQEDILALQHELAVILNKESVGKLKQEIELGRVRQKQALFSQRGYYVPNQELLQLCDVLSPNCMYVQPGVDYLAGLTPEEKASVIEAMPFLPYAVIVDQGSFEKIRSGKQKVRFRSDYTVPIVNLEAVRVAKNVSGDDIFYTCDCVEYLINKEAFSRYHARMDEMICATEKELETAKERVDDLQQKKMRVESFLQSYPESRVAEVRKRIKELIQKASDIESEQKNAKKAEESLRAEEVTVRQQMITLAEAIQKGEEEAAKIGEYVEKSAEFNSITKQIRARKREFVGIQQELPGLSKKQEEYAGKMEQLQERMVKMGNDKYVIEQQLSELVSFESIENKLLLDNVQAEYVAVCNVMVGKNLEESRLREQVTDGINRLGKLRDRILDEYNGDLREVERRECCGEEVLIPSRGEIMRLEENKRKLEQQAKVKRDEITEIVKQIANADGKLEQLLEGVPPIYHQDIPAYEDEHQYEREIREVLKRLQWLRKEEEKLAAEVQETEDNMRTVSMQLQFYESFLDREGIPKDAGTKVEIRDFNGFEKEFQGQKSMLHGLREKWNDKLDLIEKETMEFVIREPVEELRKMGLLDGVVQFRRRKEAFSEYLMNLDEQMKKISNDIEKLESYQEEFVRQCMHRAELVLGDLRKIELLSRIEYYGRRVEMIRVRLHEFEDSEKRLRMQSHIDRIVKEISEEDIMDRDRVAMRLATKELLAQIVNMDRARVMLFKVESIPEHSKHYPWESAVGSEGQNNSLYFVFAACLISYIRMLSITNTSINTKKVIIADNPFGPTSAIYLWDPIFKVLKQNNIQLIAPGHGIRREVTSRFSVNYLLNQDILQNGKRRVVVKDVRIQEDEEKMRYVEAGQLVLLD